MPNLVKMRVHEDNIVRIDKALKLAEKFLDKKVYFETPNGKELVTREALWSMRDKEQAGIRKAAE